MTRLALISVLFLALAGGATAATCQKTSLADVEDEVMCPVCGVPLGLATAAPQAQRQREFIQREVESCKSKDEIKRALVAQFGERILAMPPEKGFNLAAYLVPAVILLVGIAAIATLAVRRRRSTVTPAAAGPAMARDDAARLDADLERYDL